MNSPIEAGTTPPRSTEDEPTAPTTQFDTALTHRTAEPDSGPVPMGGTTTNPYDPHRLAVDYAHVVGSAVNGIRHALPTDCPAATATTVLAELRTAVDNLGLLLDELAQAVWRAYLQHSDDADRADWATQAVRDGALIADQLSLALQAAHHDITTLTANPVTSPDGNPRPSQEKQP